VALVTDFFCLKVRTMRRLENQLRDSGVTMTFTAKSIGVSLQDLSHFVRGETYRIGRKRRKMIREWMVSKGYLKPRKQNVTWICPVCNARRNGKANTTLSAKNEPLEIMI
jgi:hypothetical protein